MTRDTEHKYTKTQEKRYRIVAIGIGIFVGLCMGEVMLRVFTPAWLQQRMEFLNAGKNPDTIGSDGEWKYESRAGHFLKFTPNSSFDVLNREYSHRANIDELGGRRTGTTKPSGSGSILPFMGDSMTFGLGVNDEKTFASYFSERLKDQARVVNLGVPGSALHDQLFVISIRHAELGRPKAYVFFFFLGNDFNDLVTRTPYWRDPVAEKIGSSSIPDKGSPTGPKMIFMLNGLLFHNAVAKKFYFLQFVRASILRAYLRGRSNNVEPVFTMMDQDNVAYVDTARNGVREALAQLRKLGESEGFTAMVVAIPDRYQLMELLRVTQAQYYGLNAKRLDPLLPNKVLEEETRSAHVPFIDSTSCMESRAEKKNLYYTQDNHLRVSGQKAFYECVSEQLLSWLRLNK